jgi:tetratricopeptide (TPR) repeat protein
MQIPFLRVASLVLMSMLFALDGAFAQDALQPDIKKPEKFENKKLGYEKTAEKKFTLPRRFMQNTTTHYNYYFNANNKLNEIIARAKSAHKDDFTKLLPFYNYSLDKMANEKQELDSVIYKSTVAILIHDLRNNWVDNMYMLMGKAYYFRNQLDSAYQTFQYINYAFSPKEKDGYDKVIGSNSNEGGNAFSISTKEDKSLVKKAFTRPPSRNESFLWQIRTYLANEELPEAAGLIEILKADPNFPARLKPELAEVQSHWFYKQNVYDSAAIYLEKALEITENNQERARWEYLIAQLYEQSNQPAMAEKFYARAIRHTFDPVMEVHARLNSIRQNSGEKDRIQENINELLKMARKDKYLNYRDVIYYTAAQMELERKNVPGAMALLLKSTQYSVENQEQRNKSFMQLADLAFQSKDYQAARSYYDSVNIAGMQGDLTAFNERKGMLGILAAPTAVIYRQDSLQRIAGLPEAERDAYIKKLVKQLRRQQGLREDEPNAAALNNPQAAQSQAAELFTNAPKGEWYFSNPSLKAKGFNEFTSKWGRRPNVDNWRRQTAINTFAIAKQGTDVRIGDSPTPGSNNTVQELTYDAFKDNLPLTPERLKLSNDSIENAMMQLGRAFNEQVEDYPLAIETFDRLLSRYPNTPHKQEALFNLYYAYWKLGDLTKANAYKVQLQQMYPGGKYANALDPRAAAQSPDSVLKTNATRSYERIYTSFIEGNFAQALADKKRADSLYGERYWTPQLLYIEAIYHVKQRSDSIAKMQLMRLIARFADSPLRSKAENLLNVLNRRAEIENYLTNLEVQRLPDDNIAVVEDNKPAVTQQPPPVVTQQQPQQQPVTTATNPPVVKKEEPIVKKEEAPVKKEEPIAKKEEPPVKKEEPPVKKEEPKKADPPVVNKPVEQPKKEPEQKPVTAPPIVRAGYTFKSEEAHLVILVLDKVDPVYVTEARNAFNRYNREKYYTKTFEISNVPLNDDIKLMVMSNFENANAAIEYVERARKAAASEIIPWMPPGKYTFYIISPQNLEVLKTKQDVKVYANELSTVFPGKF